MAQSTPSRTWPEEQIRRFLTTRAGIWFGRYILPRIDRPLLRLSRGRISMSPGQPVLLLISKGAKTGKRRATPMLYFGDGDRLIVVASNGGRDRHPGWCHNLRAHPEATVYLDGTVTRYVAREVEDEERASLWRKAVDYFDGFTLYEQRTKRRIPIFVLRVMESERVRDCKRSTFSRSTLRISSFPTLHFLPFILPGLHLCRPRSSGEILATEEHDGKDKQHQGVEGDQARRRTGGKQSWCVLGHLGEGDGGDGLVQIEDTGGQQIGQEHAGLVKDAAQRRHDLDHQRLNDDQEDHTAADGAHHGAGDHAEEKGKMGWIGLAALATLLWRMRTHTAPSAEVVFVAHELEKQ